MKSFASDNYSGAHYKIIEAVNDANREHQTAYGYDYYSAEAEKLFKNIFGDDISVFFVFTGTAANVLSIKASIPSYKSVICSSVSHINVDETGAPENFTGSKLISIDTKDGKLTKELIEPYLIRRNDEHYSFPGMISLTQATELGTVYSIKEIKELCDFAHKNDIIVHMDGARISNAAVSLGVSFKDFTKDLGVDILSFGGAKNGLMFGEAVVIFNHKLAENFKFIRKQGMQLASKMRFISAQFTALLSDDLWYENAKKSNDLAKYFESKLKGLKGIEITQKVQANGLFLKIPKDVITEMQKHYFFYVWDEQENIVRLMMSFDNTYEEIDDFISKLSDLLNYYKFDK